MDDDQRAAVRRKKTPPCRLIENSACRRLVGGSHSARLLQSGTSQQFCAAHPEGPRKLQRGVERDASLRPFNFTHIRQRQVGLLSEDELAPFCLGSQFAHGMSEMDGGLAGIVLHPRILATSATIDYKASLQFRGENPFRGHFIATFRTLAQNNRRLIR